MAGYNPMRYGIFGIDPYGPDIGSKALSVMEGFGKIREQNAKIREQQLANEFYPKLQTQKVREAELANEFYPQLKRGEMGETRARTGLLGAQGEDARARAAYENMRTKLGVTGILAGAGGLGAGNQLPMFDKNGKVTTVESPTTASATQAQNRVAAEAEMKKIAPVIQKGLSHYIGAAGRASYLKDIYLYKFGTPKQKEAAGQRLYEYDLAKRYETEGAGINARMATGQPAGIEALREFKNSMYRNSLFSPQGIQQKGMGAYNGIQQGAVGEAINQERTGFPQQNNAPAWAQSRIQLNPMGPTTGRSTFKQGIVENPKAQNQQAQTQMPTFNSKEEFLQWRNNLTPEEKTQYRAMLSKKGGK